MSAWNQNLVAVNSSIPSKLSNARELACPVLCSRAVPILILAVWLLSVIHVDNAVAQDEISAVPTAKQQDTQNNADVGLQGLLKPFAPAGLNLDSFNYDKKTDEFGDPLPLPGVEDIAEDVQSFYEDTPATIGEQRAAIARLREHAETLRETASKTDDAEASIKLKTLARRLRRQMDLAEAVLDVLEVNNWLSPEVALIHSAQTLAQTLSGIENGKLWAEYFRLDNLIKALTTPGTPEVKRAAAEASLKTLTLGKDASAAQTEFLSAPRIGAFKSALQRYRTATKANGVDPQDTQIRAALRRQVSVDGKPNQQRRASKDYGLIVELDRYERRRLNDFATVSDGDRILRELTVLQSVSHEAGSRLARVIRKHYFNKNMKLGLQESWVQPFFATRQVETRPVVDVILGADVRGWQTSDSRVNMTFIPNENFAVLKFGLNTAIRTRTTAYKDCAEIYSNGQHYVTGDKRMRFDGLHFASGPADLQIDPNNHPYDAYLFGACLPVMGPILKNYALQQAWKNVPASEAITAGKIRRRAQPAFNNRVDEGVQELNSRVQQDLLTRLRQQDLYLLEHQARTTDSLLETSSRLGRGEEQGGSPLPFEVENNALSLFVHETALNAVARRAKIAGRTLTRAEFQNEIERLIESLVGRELQWPSSENSVVEPKANDEKPAEAKEEQAEDDEQQDDLFHFVNDDPLRIRIEQNRLILSVRAAFELASRDDVIPPRSVVLEYNIGLKDDKVVLTRSDVEDIKVDLLDDGEEDQQASRVVRFARNVAIRKRMDEILAKQRQLNGTFTRTAGNTSISLRVNRVEGIDGWLAIRLVDITSTNRLPSLQKPEPAELQSNGYDGEGTQPSPDSQPEKSTPLLPPAPSESE